MLDEVSVLTKSIAVGEVWAGIPARVVVGGFQQSVVSSRPSNG